MKKIKLYTSLLILLLLVITPLFYFFQKTYGEELEYFNIHYGAHSKQTLDIYTANSSSNSPVIVYVHGGSWVGGNKNNISEKPFFFPKHGYVFVTVNYRLSPEATYQEMADDVSAAVKWIYDHADQYGIDNKRINLMGHSAGGHLVTLIGTNPSYLHNVGLAQQTIRSIVNLEGPIDMSRLVASNEKFKRVFGEDKRIWAEASPMTYATNQYPPLFLISHKDSSVTAFMKVAGSAGNTVNYFECKTLSHRGITKELGAHASSEEGKNLTNAVANFLKAYN